jgi:hypothetical protein
MAIAIISIVFKTLLYITGGERENRSIEDLKHKKEADNETQTGTI